MTREKYETNLEVINSSLSYLWDLTHSEYFSVISLENPIMQNIVLYNIKKVYLSYMSIIRKLSLLSTPYFRFVTMGAAYTTTCDPSTRHFFLKCKMGYEYHERSHGTKVLSPWWKNLGYRDEKGRWKRGRREAAGLSGGVARVSTVVHWGKLANAESRPQQECCSATDCRRRRRRCRIHPSRCLSRSPPPV